MDRHQREIQELDQTHNHKLMAEYEKYQELQRKTQAMQEDYERQLAEMERAKAQALEDLAEFWENKLLEKASLLDNAHEEKREQGKDFAETKRQIEEDADRELLGIKNKYERKLKEERDETLRLKGENGILKKKSASLENELKDQKRIKDEMDNEQRKLHAHIKALEKDIANFKKEIEERDETIQDKENRIYDLKKKNQELEKFKFVLDYKIRELKTLPT